MSKMTVKELLDWLDDAHSSDCFDDALSKEHSTTGQTQPFWNEKARIRDQAHKQIVEIIRKSEFAEKEYVFPESREEKFMDKDLLEFYQKKGYKIKE